MSRRILKINDSAWLFAESRRTPMQVGLLATFRVPADRPDFVRDLVAGWQDVRRFQPPFNYLLSMTPVPSWVELPDDRIDLDYHFRHSALPRPGDQRELGVLVSRLHSSVMDRRYPLWECHVIEGLEDDQWSLYMKVHHSQIDGVGGVRLLRRILSADPEQRDMLPPWAVGTRGPDQSGLPERTPPETAAPERRSSLLGSGIAVAGSLARTAGESVLAPVVPGDEERAIPFRAPKTIFNERIHTPRRFATQHYPVAGLKEIATAAGASLNDVFLTICGGALRRYLVEQDALPAESLTANVPVSVRPKNGAEEGAGVGNAITFLYARLGTDIADPRERLEAVATSTRLGKERLPKVGPIAMDAYTAGLMAPFLAPAILGLGGHGRPVFNVVISNVPGPAEPRYLDGSRLEEIYPLSLLFNGQALNITAVSYDGHFHIGFTGCRDSIPHLQHIAVHCGEELDALATAAGVPGRVPEDAP